MADTSTASRKNLLRPLINYSHVLSELSVNSKNPCEVIRELVSNSYDAQATEIRYYPLIPKELGGFIFFDNGQGMSDSVRIKGVTPYESFFSIGYSTKYLGDMIGYKCQGAKLAFACKTFMLITRCEGEESWRYTTILDPREQLSQVTDITPYYTNEPWEVLRNNLSRNPTKATRRVFHNLNEDFFRNRFHHGTMIIILGFDMGRNFERYFGTKNQLSGKVKGAERHELSYIWNYIRFYTRHGDIRILNADVTDFSTIHRETVEEPVLSSEPPPTFYVWVDEDIDYGQEKFEQQLKEVPPGFPYLEKSKVNSLGPGEVSQLNSGRFYARHAGTFEYEDNLYTWILAIDGKRKTLDDYVTLDRQKAIRSGIRLADQRGPHLCAHGIKICEYRGLFSDIDKYEALSDAKSFPHYIFLLDGPFELVTDRNAVRNSDIRTLTDPEFKKRIKKSLDDICNGGEDKHEPDGIDHNAVFRSLIARLTDEVAGVNLQKELKKIDKLKQQLPERGHFTVNNGPLADRSFAYPGKGEENWVGSLYTLFSNFAAEEPKYQDSNLKDLWVRPVNMAGVSIDALAIPLGVEGLPKDKLKGLEYKLSFSHDDLFNHPLLGVHYIVCWDFLKTPEVGAWVKDDYDYMGRIKFCDNCSKHIAYEITEIQRTDRSGRKKGAIVKVISLKELIRETFDCEME